MSLGARINLSFMVLILVMIIWQAGYSIATNLFSAQKQAKQHSEEAIGRLLKAFRSISTANETAAVALSHDPAFLSAYQEYDQGHTAAAIKAFMARTKFNGFITVVNSNRNIFYNSQTNSNLGQYHFAQNAGLEYVFLHNQPWKGPTVISPLGTVSISGLAPLRSDGAITGVISANQAIDTSLLTGLAAQLMLESSALNGLQMALYSYTDHKITALSLGFSEQANRFLHQVDQEGDKAFKSVSFSAGDRYWEVLPLEESKNKIPALLLVSFALPNTWPVVAMVLGQAAISGGLGLVVAFFLSSSLANSINAPIHFLIQRARDITEQKPQLDSLEGLTGDWLELGELMDTAVVTLRNSLSSLKNQLAKHGPNAAIISEDTAKQTAILDQQISHQNRQLSELSKQINYANQQTVLLQHKLDSILQVSAEGYLLLDQYGNILTANPVMLGWLGATEGEIAGRFCFDLVSRPGASPKPSSGSAGASPAFAKRGDDPSVLVSQFFPEGLVYHRQTNAATEVLLHLQPLVTEGSRVQGWVMVLRNKSLHNVVPPTVAHKPLAVNKLVADCLKEISNKAQERQLLLDYKAVTGLPPINVDPEILKLVLTQLLEKVIAVTTPGGRVRVESQIEGQQIYLGVHSSGPTLPQEEIEDMFAGFIEGKHHEESYSWRLSLYLVRNQVERMGGRIWAESQEDGGTAIYFTLCVA